MAEVLVAPGCQLGSMTVLMTKYLKKKLKLVISHKKIYFKIISI